MTVVSETIPSFIGGVSQQPDKLKRSDQLKECVNGYPSPVAGMIKRHPTQHIKKLIDGDIGSAKCQFTLKDNGEKYVTIIPDGDLKVFDLEGTPKTVTFPDGKAYLETANPRYNIRTLSVADYIFTLNKTKQTAMTDDVKLDPYINSALVYIKSGQYVADYKIYINDVEKATYTTTTDYTTNRTNYIALQLYTQLTTNLTPASDWNIARKGSVILIQNKVGTDFTIRTEDSDGETSLICLKGTAKSNNDLPDVAPNGFILKLNGAKENEDDDYYVEFRANDTGSTSFSKGKWFECTGLGITTTIDNTTMPHALIRKADGTFSFESVPYTDRLCGDDNSNETPSFINNTINEIFAYKNRIGYLSGESVSLSSIKDIFSYFKETTLTELDTDPIDVTATTGKRGTLRYVVPYAKELLLFSALSQYVLSGSGILTAKTISIALSTEFESSLKVAPVNAGNNIFFAFERDRFTGVRQYYTNQAQVDDAEDITSWIPSYIPGSSYKIISSTLEDLVLILNGEEPNTIYAYKYLFSNGENQQAAWFKWIFNEETTIIDADFLNNTLYLVVQYSDGVYLEKIDITPGLFDIDYVTGYGQVIQFLTRLDRKVTGLDTLYDAENNETFVIFPYNTEGAVTIVDQATGISIAIQESQVINDCLVCTITGDQSDKTLIGGVNYDHYFEPGNLYYRQVDRLNNKVTVIDGELQLLDLYLNYANTGYFEVGVTPLYQDETVAEFTGMILGTPTTEYNIVPLSSGEFVVPILCKNTEVKIQIRNNTYKPSQFIDAIWEGDFSKAIGT